jgi:cytochrome c oxidase subunit 2
VNELLRRLLFLPPQASSVARELDTLHYVVISVTMLGAIAVALTAAYFVVKYRKGAARRGGSAEPGSERANAGTPLSVELGAVLGLLALFVGFWWVGFRQFIDLSVPPKNAAVVYVIAKQWMWTFAYPNGSSSNAVLYVPERRAVKLVMSSRDVIHSLFIPEFRVKKDVLPGQVTTLWFEALRAGTYNIFCTEYCGSGHSTMRAEVVVVPQAEYDRRLEQLEPLRIPGPEYVEPAQAGAPRRPVTLAEMGARVALERGCMRCHTADGTPHIGPSWANLFGSEVPLEGGTRALMDEAYITESMMDPQVKIHEGFASVMPSYQGLLSAAETGAIIEYIRVLGEAPRELRNSPLAAPASGAWALPRESSRTLRQAPAASPPGAESP